MSTKTRRSFLTDAALGVSAAVIANRSRSFAAGASEHVRVAVIGCGNQGGNHIKSLSTLKDAEIVYVSDIDPERLATAVTMSGGAKGVADFRRILDDQSIDAVTIATPDHWHVPVALLALDGRQARVRREAVLAQRARGPTARGGREEDRQSRRPRHAVALQSRRCSRR